MSEELAQLQKRYERLRLLHRISKVLHSTLEPEKALDLVAGEAVALVGASSGSIVLVNPNTGFLEILASRGLPDRADSLKLRVGEGITGWVARTGKPACVGNVAADPRYITLAPGVRSELAVPLHLDGEVRGVLNVDADRLNAFGPEEQELLEALAAEAVQVIHNTWLYEQLRLKAQLFESLASVSQAINSAVSLNDALNVITREACTLMNGKVCSLMMVDESGQWLDLGASFGAGEAYIRKPRLSVADSLLGSVVRRRKPTQVENVQVSGVYQSTDIARAEGLFGLASVPLLFGDSSLGTLNVYTASPHNFSNEEIKILSALAQLSAVAIEKARLYERVVDVEEQLRQNERLSALGLLAAEIAHEVRNPLTVMKMLYHSLDLSFPAADPRSKDARIIGEKIEHLNRIVERILDFAKGAEPRFSTVDIGALMDEMALLVRHKLKNQNIELVRKTETPLPAIKGDPTQLEQVFLNLILNAAEAMPYGGTLTIECTTNQPKGGGPHLEIRVTDTGVGMTEEHQQRVLSSVLSSTKPKGTGLGLAIVRRIVESHDGEISIHPAPGKGTVVSLTFPMADGQPS